MQDRITDQEVCYTPLNKLRKFMEFEATAKAADIILYIYIYIYIFMSSCVGGSKAPPGTISAIYTRYAGTLSTSYKNFR